MKQASKHFLHKACDFKRFRYKLTKPKNLDVSVHDIRH